MTSDVVVVGAGLAGLAAAAHLHQAGRDVVVLDSSDGVGGRIRTDVVDGFVLDRGFQVFNDAYPEARRVLDLDALGLQRFVSGAAVRYEGTMHRLIDPRREPGSALSLARTALMPATDKAALAALAAWCGYAPVSRLVAGDDTTTEAELRRRRLGPAAVERFLRPFLSGVLLDPELATSARYFRLVWRSFVRGRISVPAQGMQEIPEQVARLLPAGAVRLSIRVRIVNGDGVVTEDGEQFGARAVVVATDAATAGRLVPGLSAPAWHGVTTFYHAVADVAHAQALLVLDAERPDLITNSVILTAAAPSYSASGRALISTSVTGRQRYDAHLADVVRARLSLLHGVDERELEPVATYSIDQALPAAPPPLQIRQPVRVTAGVYVCGDWRDTPSIQGALVSGRRAARALLHDC